MIKEMTNEQYHKSEGLSKSMMDKLNESPAHFRFWLENPKEQTEAMLLGSLFHTLVLEPKTFKRRYAVIPKLDLRKSVDKATYTKFLEKNKNKELITQVQLDKATAWRDAVLNHPVAKKYLNLKEGSNEVSIFWEDKKTGEICKARFDRMIDDVVIDLKSAMSAHPDSFQKKAYDLGYYRQAAWFKDAFEQEFNKPLRSFIFIAVEKDAPYNVVVYQADDFFMEIGARDNRKLLETYHHCKETNNWYGYDGEKPQEQMLGLPNYVIARNMEEI